MNTKKILSLAAAFLFILVTVTHAEEPVAQAQFAGVGIMLYQSTTNSPVKVAQLVPDSPAAKARIQPRSTLVSINGNSTEELTLKQCVELIRGEPGTQVTLGLIDPKTKETNTFTLTRTAISLPPAKPAIP